MFLSFNALNKNHPGWCFYVSSLCIKYVYIFGHFILQDQEGLAEEEMWSEIWLSDHFPQYGEDIWTATKHLDSD